MQRERLVQPRAIDLWGHTMTTIRPCHIDGEFPEVHPVHHVVAVDHVVGFVSNKSTSGRALPIGGTLISTERFTTAGLNNIQGTFR